MGLEPGDLEAVPSELDARGCYERIVNWHRNIGEQVARQRLDPGPYLDRYLRLRELLPDPATVDEPDMDFVFRQVIAGLMEWAYHESDLNGVKMAAYAFRAVELRYEGISDPDFSESSTRSSLNAQLG